MLNLIDATKEKTADFKKPEIKRLTISDIERLYFGTNQNLIGVEYERLSLDKYTFENAPYFKLEKIIKTFCDKFSWQLIYDDKTIIGATDNNGTSISLEPGCQLEISLAPKKDILSIDCELTKITTTLDEIAKLFDVIFLGYGVSPVSSVDEIKLLNKRRYKIMNEYLPYCKYGELSQRMMRQTAGMQFNIDYKNEHDAYYKLKFFNLIMPFMAGLSANSSFDNNRLTNVKSQRANIWRYTGSDRCNFFYKEIFNTRYFRKNVIKEYVSSILNVPMLYIERNNQIINFNGKISFDDFMKNGFDIYYPNIKDYILHQSMCFPDVRFKKYIEIRNHDSNNLKTALAFCTLYKALANLDIKDILKRFNYLKIQDVDTYNENIVNIGLNYRIDDRHDGWDVVVDIFNIAKMNLSSNERTYLKPIMDMIKIRKTNSDLISEYEINDVKDLVQFLY